MITAKDDFFLEREHIQQMFELAEANGIDQNVVFEIIRELQGEFDATAILKSMYDRNLSYLERVRRGETLRQSQINKAVKQAANGF